jgi:NADPH:quinone reductase
MNIPTHYRAFQVPRFGGPEVLELKTLPMPKPGSGHALVRIHAAGVNFVDNYQRSGHYPGELPFIPGNEGAGEIVAVGPDVPASRVGQRVAWAQVRGSYAEYAVVPAARLVPVPASLEHQQAAAAMLQGMTAHYLSHSTYPIQKGDSVLIHAAAGGVGLLLAQMAKMLGATTIIGTVSTEEKAELARAAGATDVILYTQTDFEAETKRITGGKGVHVVYDSVAATTFEKGLNCLRPRGYMVLYGASSGPIESVSVKALQSKGSLFFTRPTLHNYGEPGGELEQRTSDLFRWIANGELKLRVEHVYPLEEAAQAMRDLEGRKTTGKLVLKIV